jgi:Uncharacterized conserved protein
MNESFRTSFTVNQSPAEVYQAVTNVRGWWSEDIEGDTDRLGVFKYRYKDVHRCTIRIAELEPNRKVVWRIEDNYFSFVKDLTEWVNTEVVFEIVDHGDRTELLFTHDGLVPANECYSACSDGWTTYINGSLHDLIAYGKGKPNQNEEVSNRHGISIE